MSETASAQWREAIDAGVRARPVPRRGMRGNLQRLTAALGRLAYVRESHVWYRIELPSRVPRAAAPHGIDIVRATERDLHLLDQLPGAVSRREARRRLRQGAELWLAHESGHTAFCCWVFRGRTPSLALRRGWLALPERTVALEDSVASPAYRRRGIAMATWSAIVDTMTTDQVDAIVTKVDERDIPCRRAIEKVGFRAVASMQVCRIGGCAKVALHPHDDQETTGFLAAQLSR